MYSKELEAIIDAALADGVLTDKERAVLHKRAQEEGVDPDELDVVIDGRLAKMKKEEDWLRPAPPKNMGNEKYGNILTCPSCGAQVVGGSAVCPECGYAFSNVSVSRSIKKLQHKIDDFNKHQEARTNNLSEEDWPVLIKSKMDIISTFPVPNTRADLLDCLTMIQARAKATGPKSGIDASEEGEDLSYAYWLLYISCINKAKLNFSKDNDFIPYFEHYDRELNKTKGIIGYFRRNPMACWYLVMTILFIIASVFYSAKS